LAKLRKFTSVIHSFEGFETYSASSMSALPLSTN
jgi:hypothetical protein